VKGATSFDHLKTVADDVGSVICSTFREACEARGLVDTDISLDKCL
jgi:hypothetical protein